MTKILAWQKSTENNRFLVRKLQESHKQMIYLQSLGNFVSYKKYSGALIILIDDSNRSFTEKNKLRWVFMLTLDDEVIKRFSVAFWKPLNRTLNIQKIYVVSTPNHGIKVSSGSTDKIVPTSAIIAHQFGGDCPSMEPSKDRN